MSSCRECAFYVKPVNVTGLNGSFPLSACNKYSKVLPNEFTKLEEIGNVCNDYTDKDVNSVDPHYVEPQIITDYDSFMLSGSDDKTCFDCTAYSDFDNSIKHTGIPFPACMNRGAFLAVGSEFDNPKKYACRQEVNTYSKDFSGAFDYVRKFGGNVMAVAIPEVKDNSPIKPPTFVPAKTVTKSKEATKEDKEAGIDHWLEVNPKKGIGSTVYLPVFREDFFSNSEKAKIPKAGDEEHPELYIDHLDLTYRVGAIWTGLDRTPALVGIAGSGKTEFYRYMAYLMRLPFERINVTNRMELDELAGKMLYHKERGTHFLYGRVPLSWQKPCVVLIDEPNVGSDAVWQFLRPLTDNSRQLVLDMNEGERIEKNPFCFMGMAMNPSWDSRNIGTRDISDADGRRLFHVSVPPPTADVEKKIINSAVKLIGHSIDDSLMKTIMSVSSELRRMASEDVIPIQWGVSQNVKVAQATKYFTVLDSYRLAAADMLEPEAASHIINLVKTYDS